MEHVEDLPCKEKVAFSTQKEAQAAAVLAQHHYGSKVKPYLCKYCNLWHLASK